MPCAPGLLNCKLPDWARPLAFADYFSIRYRRFRDQLAGMLAETSNRVVVNRRGAALTVAFGGDTNQSAQFARSVPDFVLKGRFVDLEKLDLQAQEQEIGFSIAKSPHW